MRLLVSVRSAAEVGAAVAGGADIVDAKEPAAARWRGERPRPPGDRPERAPGMPLSIALGEPKGMAALEAAMAALHGLAPGPGPAYVKIGLSAAGDGTEAAAFGAGRPGIADAAPAIGRRGRLCGLRGGGRPRPRDGRAPGRGRGRRRRAADTWSKDGGDLFQHLAEPALRAWIEQVRAAGLLVALAGSLSIKGVRAVAELPADIVGVRGAACVGGRTGVVSEGAGSPAQGGAVPGCRGQRVAAARLEAGGHRSPSPNGA